MSLTITAPKGDTTQGVGKPVRRIDGISKVTGEALYGADQVVSNLAYGVFATSPRANCKITAIDAKEAESVPGVLQIFTHENDLGIQDGKPFSSGGITSQSFMPMQSPEVKYEGQQIAFVIADSLEAAEEAAQLIDFTFSESSGVAMSIGAETAKTEMLSEANPKHEDISVGDAAAALRRAEHKISLEYTTPTQHHNAIEPYTITAQWHGEMLTIYEPSQWLNGLKFGLAEMVGIPPENLQIVSPFIGGAFGSKATLAPHALITTLAARKIGRPIKTVISRTQMFTAASYRAEAHFKIDAACDSQGNLTALSVDDNQITSRFDPVTMNSADIITRIYKCPNIVGVTRITHVDTPTPGFMRAPAEVPGMFALESAIDELAEAAGIDPIEFRAKNEPERDPVKDLPYSSRSLVQCYEKGAEMFGWADRPKKAKSVEKDGAWVGYGCATSLYPANVCACAVKLKIDFDGKVEIESASHDPGTGTWTVIGQIASEFLDVPLNEVSVSIGDSDFPPGAIAGGSTQTASLTRAVANGCDKIKNQLFEIATKGEKAPLAGESVEELSFKGKKVTSKSGKSVGLEELMNHGETTTITAVGEAIPPGMGVKGMQKHMRGTLALAGSEIDGHVCSSWGAQFVEVHVDKHTYEIRVPRHLGVFAAGQILNEKGGRSQLSGGMIWGIGSALHEATRVDHHIGKWVNKDLAEYLVPVNADIRDLQVEIIPEEDKIINPLGAKGIGELAIVGTNAALANAVYNATGIRVRDLPLTLDKLIA